MWKISMFEIGNIKQRTAEEENLFSVLPAHSSLHYSLFVKKMFVYLAFLLLPFFVFVTACTCIYPREYTLYINISTYT